MLRTDTPEPVQDDPDDRRPVDDPSPCPCPEIAPRGVVMTIRATAALGFLALLAFLLT
ncbi:MAG: hypothetical protein HOV68_22805 [Streptomycetaceae bacterium]|nr:hypothetical protein [Streptomycetaceae bacterium]